MVQPNRIVSGPDTTVAREVPAVADIETRLKDMKNAVFAKYAFGVRR
jgi:hypothetical protein